MANKLILTCLLFLISATIVKAQDALIKDNMVLLNGKAILKYEKVDALEFSFYALDSSGDEIIMFKWVNDGKLASQDASFNLYFLTAKTKILSKATEHVIAGMGMNYKKNMEKMINWLLKEKVLTADGNINLDKLDIFYQKYNEDPETIIKIEHN